jgi:hypothetical protein
LLAVGGCDKNMPGCLMAMARLNIPSIFVYGGSILPGVSAEGKDVDIVQAQSQMTPGSHHLFIFALDPAADAGGSELEPCSGLEFHELVYGSQRPTSATTYPPGVGQFLGGGKGLRLQAHYLNTGTETIHAQVQTTFDVATEPVLAHAAWMILNDNMVNVALGSSSASSSLALIPEIGDVKLILAESHMHRHGVHFTSSLGDGTPIYETDQWNDPALRTSILRLSCCPAAP